MQLSDGLKHAKLHQALVQNKSDIKPASVIYTDRLELTMSFQFNSTPILGDPKLDSKILRICELIPA